MMRETSLAANHQHWLSGAAASQREYILSFLKKNGPRTRQQISESTGIPINSVCGRVNELVKKEQVTDKKQVKTAYGRRAYLVEVVDA